MFRVYLVLGLVWLGLGVAELVQGELLFGSTYLAWGVAWVVIAILKRKGILPEGRHRPPPPNPYQENLPG